MKPSEIVQAYLWYVHNEDPDVIAAELVSRVDGDLDELTAILAEAGVLAFNRMQPRHKDAIVEAAVAQYFPGGTKE